jgi:hypothetical protein
MKLRRVVCVCLAAWAALMLPRRAEAQGGGVVDGYRYTMTGTQTSGGMPGRPDGTQAMEVRGQVAGGVLRTETPVGGGPFSRPGVYTLMDGRTNEVVLIDSVARKIVAISEGLTAAVGNLAAEMTISDTASTLEELGPGEVVLGYPTRKVRLTIRYAMSVGDNAESKTSTVQVTTVHVSDAVTALDPGFALTTPGAMSPVGKAAPGTALEQYVATLTGKLPKGFALVLEQEMRITAMAMEVATASRMRVTELAPVRVAKATLSPPAGFEKADYMTYMMAAMQAPR